MAFFQASIFNKGKKLLSDVLKGNTVERVCLNHIHLGGSVPLHSTWDMAKRDGNTRVSGNLSEFIQHVRKLISDAKSLDDYVSILHDVLEPPQMGAVNIGEAIRHSATYIQSTEGILEFGNGFGDGRLEAFRIGYAEVRFNPSKRAGPDIDLLTILESANTAAGRMGLIAKSQIGNQSTGRKGQTPKSTFKVKLILSFARDRDDTVNRAQAEAIAKARKYNKNICGIDLAGPESPEFGFDLSKEDDLNNVAEWFDIAGGTARGRNSLGRTIHIGETKYTDTDSMERALRRIQPERIGHGIKAYTTHTKGNNQLLNTIKDLGIVMELMPYSNYITGIVPDPREWEKILSTLDSFEIPYCFSTDSPCLHGVTLACELAMLMGYGALKPDQLIRSFHVAEKSMFRTKKD